MKKNAENFVICDAGGTSSKWSVCNSVQGEIYAFHSVPLHPAVDTFEAIREKFQKHILPELLKFSPQKVFFYGAGFAAPQQQNSLKKIFAKHGLDAEVSHDLLGAARSVLFENQGFIFILGTGSNLGFYDGKKISETLGGYGYLLGDEGGGFDLSKRLLKKMLLRETPPKLVESFRKHYKQSPQEFLQKVYASSAPNKTLAELTRWFVPLNSPYVLEKIVKPAFREFRELYYESMKNKYPTTKLLGFVGSISFLYREILKEIFPEETLSFARNALPGLIKYHLEKFPKI